MAGNISSANNPNNPPRPIVTSDLSDAVAQLQRYFQLTSFRDLIPKIDPKDGTDLGALRSLAIMKSLKDPKVSDLILKLLLNTTAGGMMTPDLVAYVDDRFKKGSVDRDALDTILKIYTTELHKFIRVENPDSPCKASPSISALNVYSIRSTPAARNSSAANIFMNAVPSIEMSRCVPYLAIEVLTPGTQIVDDRVAGLSLVKFLEGATQVRPGSADHLLLRLSQTLKDVRPDDSARPPSYMTTSGMELFTSPQTLVNGDANNERSSGDYQRRVVPVADPFRPFMSINEVTIDVTPQMGMINYKTARLQLVLHDRTRLHEIAHFVKPDLYATTEFLIEYGWSHPDDPSVENVFGNFLNSMRVAEKYSIVNSSFHFDESGQVNIELSLAMKGGHDVFITNIASDATVLNAQLEIQKLSEAIGRLREEVFGANSGGKQLAKDIRGSQVLDAAESNAGQIEISNEFRKSLKLLVDSLDRVARREPDRKRNVQELKTKLLELYGGVPTYKKIKEGKKSDNGRFRTKDQYAVVSRTTGKIGELRKTIADAIDQKMKLLDGPDPFLPNVSSDFVSFGKIMSVFMQGPLAATGKFDDIQFVYYLFNANSAGVRSKPLSEFKIEKQLFRLMYTKMSELIRGRAMSLYEFMEFMKNSFFDDITTSDYGLVPGGAKRDPATGKINVDKKIQNDIQANIAKMADLGELPDGTFVAPRVDAYVETIPVVPRREGVPVQATRSGTILRVHFFDRAASPYAVQAMFNASAISSKLMSLTNATDPSGQPQTSDHQATASEIKALAEELNVFRIINPQKGADGKASGAAVVEILGGYPKLKSFIKSTMPSITYGTQNSAVKQMGLKSLQDGKLSTINMMRAGIQSPVSPEGIGPGGLPLRVAPAQLDMMMIGCPIVSYGQQFFVDCDTGTSIDNVYGAFKITHNIGPGKFETRLSLNPQDAYGRYESLIMGIGKAATILNEG